MGGTCCVAQEGEGHRSQFYPSLFTCESPFGGVFIHMRYNMSLRRGDDAGAMRCVRCVRACVRLAWLEKK